MLLSPTTGCQLVPPSPFALSSSQQSPKSQAGLGHFSPAFLRRSTFPPTKPAPLAGVFYIRLIFLLVVDSSQSCRLYFTSSHSHCAHCALANSCDAHHCPSYVPAMALWLWVMQCSPSPCVFVSSFQSVSQCPIHDAHQCSTMF